MFSQNFKCEKCGKLGAYQSWCKLYQIKHLKENFTNWSGNEKIDNFIQEMQLQINSWHDIIFEWIPYNNFDDINEIKKYDFYTIYSAIWKDGPLWWRYRNKNYNRVTYGKKVALKRFH